MESPKPNTTLFVMQHILGYSVTLRPSSELMDPCLTIHYELFNQPVLVRRRAFPFNPARPPSLLGRFTHSTADRKRGRVGW